MAYNVKVFRVYGHQDAQGLVELRCNQIINYFQLRDYTDTAARIIELKDEYGLKGDFTPIQQLLERVNL